MSYKYVNARGQITINFFNPSESIASREYGNINEYGKFCSFRIVLTK